MSSPVIIQETGDCEAEVLNLERNDAVSVTVENFKIYIKRTDEGIVVDIQDVDLIDGECLASICAFDSDTATYREE